MPVNPKHVEFARIKVYPTVASLPTVEELAVICTPPATVPTLVGELGACGTRAAIMITAGLEIFIYGFGDAAHIIAQLARYGEFSIDEIVQRGCADAARSLGRADDRYGLRSKKVLQISDAHR